MTRRLIGIPGLAYRSVLRLIGTMITCIFTLYIYVSGQGTQSSQNKSNSTSLGNNDSATIPVIPQQIIGDTPALYGMPYADYAIKGTIRDKNSNAQIPDLQVTITDSATKETIGVTKTNSDGSFSFAFKKPAWLDTWTLDIKDLDGKQNGSYLGKDTMISMPRGNYQGGGSFYLGTGTMNVDLMLTGEAITKIKSDMISTGKLRHSINIQSTNGAIGIRYSIEKHSRVAINLFSFEGKLVRSISDKWEGQGEHAFSLDPSCLASGTYLLKVQTENDMAMSTIHIER